MAQKVEKETARNLMIIPGNVRGTVILADAEYIRQKLGNQGLKLTEKRLRELGCPFLFDEIKPMEYYPEAFSVLVILLARELLDLDDEGVFEMGKSGLKHSFFVRILTKYFLSAKRCFEESPTYWKKHFDFGTVETVKFDEQKRSAVFRVKGYKFHPIMCIYHEGYFQQIAQMAIGKKDVTIEETKCVFKGEPYHEYIIRW